MFRISGTLRVASGASHDFNLFVAEVPEAVPCQEVTIAPGTASEVAACPRND